MITTLQSPEKQIETSTSFTIAETFNSLQGEGAHTGEYSTFIRFNACNLHCPFCFIGTTAVKTINGNKRIDSLKVGDLVYSFNHSTNTVELKKILKLYKNTITPDKLVKVDAGDKVLFSTEEHPFYSKEAKKYVPAKDLKFGDTLMHIPANEWQKIHLTRNNPMKNEETREKVSKIFKSGYADKTYMGYEWSDNQKLNQSNRMIDNNPMKNNITVLKNMISHDYKISSLEQKYIDLFESQNMPIEYVGNNKDFYIGDDKTGYRRPDFKVVDHNKVVEVYDTTFPFYTIGDNHGRRTEENYEKPLIEYYAQFGFEVVFLTQKDLENSDISEKLFECAMNGDHVISVKYLNNKQLACIDNVNKLNGYRKSASDPINVYNIEVEDNNNYFANGILVHNCDTQEVMDNGKYKLTSEELIQSVEHTGNIVFTGGEPTLPKYRLQMIEMIDIVLSEVVTLNRITTETNGAHLMAWFDTLQSKYPNIKKDYSWSPKYYDNPTYENTLVYLQTIKNNYRKVSNSQLICKIVLDENKIEEFENLCSKWLSSFPKNTLYIMAMGDTTEKLKKTTAKALEYQMLYGCSFSPRLHIELGLK